MSRPIFQPPPKKIFSWSAVSRSAVSRSAVSRPKESRSAESHSPKKVYHTPGPKSPGTPIDTSPPYIHPQKSGMGKHRIFTEAAIQSPQTRRKGSARRFAALRVGFFRLSARIDYRRFFGRFRASVRSRADSSSVRNAPAPVAVADTMRTQERRRRALRNLKGYGRRDGSRAREQSRRRASHQERLSSIS